MSESAGGGAHTIKEAYIYIYNMKMYVHAEDGFLTDLVPRKQETCQCIVACHGKAIASRHRAGMVFV